MKNSSNEKVRKSTFIGLAGGAGMLVVMVGLAPENISAFFNLPGLIVVIGGTLAATLICRPLDEVTRVIRSLPRLLDDDDKNKCGLEVEQLLSIAEHVRHGRIRNAEHELEYIDSAFLRTGVQLVLDRAPTSELTKVLRWQISGAQTKDQADIQILRTMATFAPAFGMLGTLFGLVHMLYDIGDANLATIGSSMGFAIISTLYGIVAANLFLKPLAMKLERSSQQRILQLIMLEEGIYLLAERQHPVLIRETLDAFATHKLNDPSNIEPLPWAEATS